MSAPAISIQELARYDRLVSDADDAVQDAQSGLKATTLDYDGHTKAMTLAYDHNNAVRDLIFTVPAVTMADAVAVLGRAMLVADDLVSCELTQKQVGDVGTKLARALASIFPVLVAAAGVAPSDLVDEWCIGQHEVHFGVLRRAMAARVQAGGD